MKNIKYLGFVGLGCAALLLTGCGGSGSAHSLTCTISEDGKTQELIYEFDEKEEKVTGAKMIINAEIPEGTSDEEIEQEKSQLTGFLCSSGMLENCDVDVSGNKLEFEGTVTEKGLTTEGFVVGSKEEVKKTQEADGYTCK